MKKIALVCEGGTDQRFLEALLDGIYGDKVQALPIQPVLDATDKDRQGDFGGWENVFSFFERPTAVYEVFSTNDHLLIQIDTDVCEHENFAIKKQTEGRDKTIIELVTDVRDKLVEKIGIEIFDKFKDRITFAICVHSLECWILPLYAKKPADIVAILNCEARLHTAFAADKKKYEKNSSFYRKHCKPIRKAAGFKTCYESNESFRIFVDSLPKFEEDAESDCLAEA